VLVACVCTNHVCAESVDDNHSRNKNNRRHETQHAELWSLQDKRQISSRYQSSNIKRRTNRNVAAPTMITSSSLIDHISSRHYFKASGTSFLDNDLANNENYVGLICSHSSMGVLLRSCSHSEIVIWIIYHKIEAWLLVRNFEGGRLKDQRISEFLCTV